ncbi:MAG: SUMF1/EgtB/PvdO family nonheme iron enzyme [Verrucomicrobiae bacterium]|nr:SUMF1/EgtB/PvdO family nonheme iron enzyme [Verrucomicrobiae bacterium]
MRIRRSQVPRRGFLGRLTGSVGAWLSGSWVWFGGARTARAAEGKTFTSSLGIRMIPLGDDRFLAATETTQAQWRALMDGNPSAFVGDDLPVETVRWDEAVAFCRLLTDKERKAGTLPEDMAYTLPSSAEWERACRPGAAVEEIAGLDEVAWTWRNSDWKTHPVGTRRATGAGFHDLQGNVREWCRDEFNGGRAIVGCGWRFGLIGYRTGDRDWCGESGREYDLGFRVALVPEKDAVKWEQPPVRRSSAGVSVAAPKGDRIEVPDLPERSRVFSRVNFPGKELSQHLPFEFSPEFLGGKQPAPERSTEDGEYHKVVVFAWSGINTRNSYLRAVEATCFAMRDVADEIHAFATKSDFERMRKFPEDFPFYSRVPKSLIREHEAEAENLIRELKSLYLQALRNPTEKMFVVLNFSNHGDVKSNSTNTDVIFSIPGCIESGEITERHLAQIGKLLAPLDATIVFGNCFSGDHDDIIVQNLAAQKQALASLGFPFVMGRSVCSATKGGFGNPTYDADQFGLYEQSMMYSGSGRTTAAANFAVNEHQRQGLAELQRRFVDGYKYGANTLSTRAEKLALYFQGIGLYSEGKQEDPQLIDETMSRFFSPETTRTDIDALGLPEEVARLLRVSQTETEQHVRRLRVPGLEDFTFSSSEAAGRSFAAQLAEEGASKTNVKTPLDDFGVDLRALRDGLPYDIKDTSKHLDDLMREADILDQQAATVTRRILAGKKDRVTYNGQQINFKTVQAKQNEIVKFIYTLLDGDLHRRQLATALINRHLLTVKMLTDPRFQGKDGQLHPLQAIWCWYRTGEFYEMLPQVHPEYRRTGQGPKALRRYLGPR